MRIVFMLWSLNQFSGGIKSNCRQAALLSQAGMPAVVCSTDGAPANWFENKAQVIVPADIRPDDVLVMAENSADDLQRYASAPNPKVVYCRNAHYIWQGLNGRGSYSDFGVRHVLAPAHSVLHFLRRRMPELTLYHVPSSVDPQQFACPQQKDLRIAYTPRKRPWEVPVIRDAMAGCHTEFAQIPWLPLEDLPETQFAAALGGSAIFLSLARQEAHSLTVLEAMSCGCIVAGYSGNPGGSDSSTAANGLWAPEDDVFDCAEQLAQAARLVSERGHQYQAMVRAARITAAQYSPERVATMAVDAWTQILGKL